MGNIKEITIKYNKKIDVRCPSCQKKLAESNKPGTNINIKCPRCSWSFNFIHSPNNNKKEK